MKNSGRARGSFGGNKTGTTTTPKESDDTLISFQQAWMFDLWSEGPIAGLADRNWNVIPDEYSWPKAVFFNETQLMTDGGTPTFSNVIVVQRWGYDNQPQITTAPSATDTVSIGVQIYYLQPFTFAIDDPNTTRVSVGIRIPTLELQDNKGNIGPYSVVIRLWMSFNGSGFQQIGNQDYTISGKCSSDYTQEFNFALPKSNTPENDYWQIQVSREQADDSDSKHRSATVLDYYTRIVDAPMMYPGCAYACVGINALSFSSIPDRGYRIKGKLIQVPSNYFPDTRAYTRAYWNGGNTGVEQPWNGTFYTAWSNNPAWVFYDIATNTRYGAGSFIGNNIDIWALYEIAQYCDELVPDGIGGQEPRFTLNTYVQTQEQAWKVLSDFASCFRGMIYWGGGTVVPVQDRPKPMIQVFTNSNVIGAVFSYSDTEIKNRQSDATVTWNDPADFFNQKLERITNMDARNQFGFREAQFAAFGCTSRGQATRAGKYFLETNLIETETVVFQTGFEGIYLRPGDIIGVSDNDRIGLRSGGRVVMIASANIPGQPDTYYVTIDAPIRAVPDATEIWFYAARNAQTAADVPAGNTYASEYAESNHPSLSALGVIYSMGGLASNVLKVISVQSNTLPSPGSGAAAYAVDETMQYETLNRQPLPNSIGPGSIWVLSRNWSNPSAEPIISTYRIIDITEKEAHVLQITGVTYESGKYDEIDLGYQFAPPLLTLLPPITYVLMPNNLVATLQITVTNETVQIAVKLSWQSPTSTVRSYRMSAQFNGGPSVFFGETQETSAVYPTLLPGTYRFAVQSINFAAVPSNPAFVSIVVPDASQVLAHRISGLEIHGQGNNAVYSTPDVTISWRLNSPSRYCNMNSQEPYGANTGAYDPYFRNFQIVITDGDTNVFGWQDSTTSLNYVILYSRNASAWPDKKPRHKLSVEVYAENSYNVSSPSEFILIDNPPPAPVAGLSVSGGSGRATLEWIPPAANDLALFNIYRSATPIQGDAVIVNTAGANANQYTSPVLASGTYYWGVTAVDTFGSESPMTLLIATTL